MRKIAYAIDLRDDPRLIEEYREHHRNVWPEVEAGLKSVGIRELNIYKVGRRLFMLLEVDTDFDSASALTEYLENDPRCQEWQDLMDRFQAPLPEAEPGGNWVEMENICLIA